MLPLPAGTITFLFTDIEGSTRRWEESPETMRLALADHDALLRASIQAHAGTIFKTVGDAFYAVFANAVEALGAAAAIQRALLAHEWSVEPLRVRIALHSGEAEVREDDYFGPTVNRVARLLSAGHGGQILLSQATVDAVAGRLAPGLELRDLGERRLKDLTRPERIYQLVAPDLPAEFPALRTLDARLVSLPSQPTPFLGREREVAQVCALLRQPSLRLVTLTGPGGTGKTRLSLQVAADLADQFEHGVYFVGLSPLVDPALVPATIAKALGLAEQPGAAPLDTLKAYLRDRQLLLLLDNFEQLMPAAPVVAELLEAAPLLKVIVTSRILLHLYGEHDYAVPPLGLPQLKELPPLEQLSQSEAVQLFVTRARALKSDFVLSAENAAAVAELCHRLDGLPLALELAAARVRMLAPQVLLARLVDTQRAAALQLLTGGGRDLPARQQTLRGAIDWSYNLLDEPERVFFRALGVFVGGWTFEAAEAVCGGGPEGPIDVLGLLESLLDKSLLRQEVGAGGEPRFRMLATIREYALDQLERQGEAEALRERHGAYFLAFARQADGEITRANQKLWLDRFDQDHGNLRQAIAWTIERRLPEQALAFASHLWRFWRVRSHRSEGAELTEAILALEGVASLRTIDHVQALLGLGYMTGELGRREHCIAYMRQALELARELGDRRSVAMALKGVSLWTAELGYQARRQLDEESLALLQALGDQEEVAWTQLQLATLIWNEEHDGAVLELLREVLANFRALAHVWGEGIALSTMAMVQMGRQEWAEARALLRQSQVIFETLGDPWQVVNTLNNMARLEQLSGSLTTALELYGASLAIIRDLGARHYGDWIVLQMASAALERSDFVRARPLLAECLRLFVLSGEANHVAETLAGVAGLLVERDGAGAAPLAARLLGRAEGVFVDELGWEHPLLERPLYQRILAATRALLDEPAYAAAWAEGRALATAEAVRLAEGALASGTVQKPLL